MKVIATKLGYYDMKRQYPEDATHKNAGQPFKLSDPKHFSKKWMKVQEEVVAAHQEVPESVPVEEDEDEPTGDEEVI